MLHVLRTTLREPDGRDVPLLRFNRGRARLKAVSGQCWLSVAGVNWTQTELTKLHVHWKQYVLRFSARSRNCEEQSHASLSVRSEQFGSRPIFMELGIWVFFEYVERISYFIEI